MKQYKLTEDSPLVKKVRKLEALCEELDITIEVGFNNQMYIQHGGKAYQYRDIEQDITGYEVTDSFPWWCETKIIIEGGYND